MRPYIAVPERSQALVGVGPSVPFRNCHSLAQTTFRLELAKIHLLGIRSVVHYMRNDTRIVRIALHKWCMAADTMQKRSGFWNSSSVGRVSAFYFLLPAIDCLDMQTDEIQLLNSQGRPIGL